MTTTTTRPAAREGVHLPETRPATLTVIVVRGSRATTLHLAGELEATTVPLLYHLVADALDQDTGDLCLDLTRTAFCGVRGLNCLLAARRLTRSRGRRLSLVGTAPVLQHLLRLSGAADVMTAQG